MKITEWMDSISDDTVEFSNMQDISYERIKERTMKKINENGRKHTKWKLVGKVVAAAVAIAALSFCGLEVYAQLHQTTAKEMLGDWIYGSNPPKDPSGVLEKIGTTDFGLGQKEENGVSVSKGIESNGTTVTPIAEICDGYELYLQLRIEAPEGTKLTGHDSEKKAYCLFSGDDFVDPFPGYKGSWGQGDTYYLDQLYNDAVDSEEKDNIITITLHYILDENESVFNMPKVFHFEGVWTQDTNKKYVKVLDGSWDIPLDHIQVKEPLNFNLEHCGSIGQLKITELGYYPVYEKEVAENSHGEDIDLNKDLTVVLKDGTVRKPAKQEYGAFWAKTFALEDVDHIMIKDQVIEPEKKQGEK